MLSLRPLLPCFFFVTAISARAHHGRDFILLQDWSVPEPFAGFIYGTFEFASHPGPDEWSLEPGVMMGAGRGLSLGTTIRLADDGEGWDYRAVSPQFQFQLTPADTTLPIRFAASGGYQFVRERSTVAPHDHGPVICGPEYGPDAPPCDEVVTAPHDHGTHAHSGIHQHDVSGFFGRLIMETDLTGDDKVVVNILHLSPEDGESAWGYAAAWRHSFTHDFAMALETAGDFDRHGYQEAVLAATFNPSHHCTLKLGIGTGLTRESPDLSVRTGLVWRF